jgi:hypothetical protein
LAAFFFIRSGLMDWACISACISACFWVIAPLTAPWRSS